MKEYIPVITIDGPGGSGKGTVSLRLARELGWHFLDSGVIYRVLATAVLDLGIDLEDEEKIAEVALTLPTEMRENAQTQIMSILLADKDVTEQIRTEKCGSVASKISALPKVRAALVLRQRNFRQFPGLVTDGRDMGTVIFPDADIKIFLTASVEERARRRHRQLQQQGINVSLEDLVEELRVRDARDINRDIAPLKPAQDAHIIDTTEMTVDEVLVHLRAIVLKRGRMADSP